MKSKSYNVKIQAITPFHIGSGELHDPMNLIIKGNTAYYLKQLEYIRYLMKRNKPELETKLALSDIKQIHRYFADCFDPAQEDCYSFSYSVSERIAANYRRKMENIRAEGQIRAFIRSGLSMEPIIPGSSLKGAIRTAILSHWIKDVPRYNLKNADQDDRNLQAKILGYQNNNGFPDIPSDPFKALKIGDAPWSNSWISIFEVAVTAPPAAAKTPPRPDPFRNPRPKPIAKAESLPVLMELGRTMSGAAITHTELDIIVIDPKLKGINKLIPEGPEKLEPMLKLVNDYYRNQLEKEESIYSRFKGNAEKHYNMIKSHFPALKYNQCMIKLGMGTGQNYCSYQAMNHNPKTRKLVGEIPLGWMKLSFEPKD